MNSITFPRTGYDGRERTQKQIEDWFVGELFTPIQTNLCSVVAATHEEQVVKKYLLIHLRNILLGRPQKLYDIKERIRNKYPTVFASKKHGSFNKRVLDAFNYVHYRKNTLITLSKYLGIKTCPYCNAQYTLYLDVRQNASYPKGIARFQYDHFFNKSDAPYLSMSLYNLIPSCASCNLAKHQGDLPVELNPYASDVQSMFKFRLKEPYRMWTGAKVANAAVRLAPTSIANASLVTELDKGVYLHSQYSRHGDVAQDVFDRAYTFPYYANIDNYSNMLTPMDATRFRQIWLGTYTEKKDIDKRPLTKFAQDLWEQANEVLGRNNN